MKHHERDGGWLMASYLHVEQLRARGADEFPSGELVWQLGPHEYTYNVQLHGCASHEHASGEPTFYQTHPHEQSARAHEPRELPNGERAYV